MFLIRKPTALAINHFRQAQGLLDFTYAAVGATRDTPPPGFVVDRTREQIGVGETTFRRAQEALRNWRQLELGWVSLGTPPPAVKPGETVSVLARVYGLWSLNACRIVYVTQQQNPWPSFGYAYGTLPDHAETGEERFLVEWTPRDDAVYYDILAFSRPHHFLSQAGYPIARRLQRRFARDSMAAMRHAVAQAQ
ncbi:MAG: DUF1990 domain-containing protein [Planctomycetota bacterium]|nr:DUF1990 domain-containing protein [Planctomycetota bacterium]